MNEPESPAGGAEAAAPSEAADGRPERAGSGQSSAGRPGAAQAAGAGSAENSVQRVAEEAEFAERAEHAEFAEFAEHAEFAEFAEHAEHVDYPHVGPDDAVGQHHHRLQLGHARPSGQADTALRSEFMHLFDQAATRLQAAGANRLRRQDRPEPRWPVTASVVAAIVLQRVLPAQLALRPVFHYLLLGFEVALLVGLAAANPVRIERHSRPIRSASVTLIMLITAANAFSALLLINAIVTGQLHSRAIDVLGAGAAIWGTNVIAFALWYWEFDRGGPVHRLEGRSSYPDLLFPQMTEPELTPPGWGPRFVDYLYMSFTNATAFSPTDVLPMARWAKLTMLVQSAVSLALGALVIARAINIL